MPAAREWTPQADKTIIEMRASGETWAAIGMALGISRNAIIERGRRLHAVAPAFVPQKHGVARMTEPLPAGHPATWSLISSELYPSH